MTNRSRSARVLREVRTRLRDVAAASHAVAAAAHDDTRRSLAAEEDRLEAFLDAAHHALSAARNVTDFELLAGHIDGHKQAIDGATEVHATSATRMKQSHLDLVASTRQLKTAEKIVERIDNERARVDARHEQRAQDDLSRRRADHWGKP